MPIFIETVTNPTSKQMFLNFLRFFKNVFKMCFDFNRYIVLVLTKSRLYEQIAV
jgi:hypothetical protein